jgi:hypothetical protein
MGTEAVLGGLIGSILTVLITKLLDLLQRSKEHRYSLERLFFERKLNVAEAAVRNWFTVAGALNGLSLLYEEMAKEPGLHPELFGSTSEFYVRQLTEAEEASERIASSLPLYFDVQDSEFFDVSRLRQLYVRMSSLQARLTSILHQYTLLRESGEAPFADYLRESIARLEAGLKPEIQELSSILDASSRDLFSALQSIRKEMIRYETQ